MRKNRRVSKKLSTNVAATAYLGIIIASAFGMVIFYMLASSSCEQLSKSIGTKEKELARLEDSYRRESLRWEEMITTRRVERALVDHGLAMRPAKAEQNIIMERNGKPRNGQYSLVVAGRRSGGTNASVVKKR